MTSRDGVHGNANEEVDGKDPEADTDYLRVMNGLDDAGFTRNEECEDGVQYDRYQTGNTKPCRENGQVPSPGKSSQWRAEDKCELKERESKECQ